MLLVSCSVLTNAGVKVITPSNVNISENRDVSGFHAIEFSTVGKINVIQGDKESLNISGPDNLVPEISTTVSNGTLIIKNKENITVTSFNSENVLTFTIVVKDLTSFAVSGAGDVQVEALSTPSMDLTMSGAGRVQMKSTHHRQPQGQPQRSWRVGNFGQCTSSNDRYLRCRQREFPGPEAQHC